MGSVAHAGGLRCFTSAIRVSYEEENIMQHFSISFYFQVPALTSLSKRLQYVRWDKPFFLKLVLMMVFQQALETYIKYHNHESEIV